jgi:DEAD/DEAH box helicase domain-containing protein
VQDAAHRAGFFGARTYMNNVRTAWAHVMDELGLKAMPWSSFIEQAHAQFNEPVRCCTWSRRGWCRISWSEHGLAARLVGRAAAEESSARRQPLAGQGEKAPGVAAVQRPDLPEPARPDVGANRQGGAGGALGETRTLAERLSVVFQEQYGAQGVDTATVGQWLWALTRMRQRGGVMDPN